MIEFEWDPQKARTNWLKHRVRFAEAATVLRDPLGITVFDPDHSQEEDRYITLLACRTVVGPQWLRTRTAAIKFGLSVYGPWAVPKESNMKKKSAKGRNDDLRPEYDLRELLKTGVQGKYAHRYREGTNLVLLAPDVAEVFPTAEAVNETLRLVLELTKLRTQGRKSARST